MPLSHARPYILNHKKTSRIEITKQAHKFSIAHFTIFSETEREDLHGHNFQVECQLSAPVGADGLIFDYGIIKASLHKVCHELDGHLVLPEKSPHLKIKKEDKYLVAIFNKERLPFLYRDVITLPIANTTVEEFSHYFLDRFLKDVIQNPGLHSRDILEMSVIVSSSPGQKGIASWAKDEAPAF